MTLAVEAQTVPEVRPTYQQYRVLVELTRDGADNETIARRLRCSVDTVKTHMKRLLAKTPYKDRTELVVGVIRRDVVIIRPEQRGPVE